MNMKTAGQVAYERDVEKQPTDHVGARRPEWHELPEGVRESWERNPTDRKQGGETPPHYVHYESAYGSEVRLSFAVRVF
jgi:hypothetical protein